MNNKKQSHSRKNILTGEWVLVSPNRLKRPWQGETNAEKKDIINEYEKDCYLCPGNSRANNQINPNYKGILVFDNDFPSLSDTNSPKIKILSNEIFTYRSERGRCRVICYTEKHNQRLATMPNEQIVDTLKTINSEFVSLDQNKSISYIQIFENRGKMMGCSNQHPHAQIWATENIPGEIEKELKCQSDWFNSKNSPLLSDYRDSELTDGSRIVIKNDDFIALVPYWAIWPYEIMLLPRRFFSAPNEMKDREIKNLAKILKSIFSGYDKMFNTNSPYSMGFHPRPSDEKDHPEWLFHGHIYPPLLRSSKIKKHLVGFEMLAMPQRDISPEEAAENLRKYC